MRKIKFIQINIFKGKYLDALIEFIKEEDPDFVAMQEVTAGTMNFYEDKTVNLFDAIKESTGLAGVFHNDAKLKSDLETRHGNAVLSKYPILSSEHLVLRSKEILLDEEFRNPKYFPDFPRGLVDATVNLDGRLIHVLSAHGAWTAPPADTPEVIRQANLIAEHLATIREPFIFGADMNFPPEFEVIKIISTQANNLILDSDIVQTTHPTIHKIAPKGFLIDYIFASPDFKLVKIEAPEIIVSDHLPVVAELKIDT